MKKGTLIVNGRDYSNGGGSASGDNYSTEEQIIGTWIDGKPLYRKIVQANLNLTGGVWNEELSFDNGIILVRSEAYMYNDTRYFIPLTYGAITNAHASYRFNYSNHKIQIGSYNDGWSSWNFTIIMEYTKTTDVATRMTDAQALAYLFGQEVLEKELSDNVATLSVEDVEE